MKKEDINFLKELQHELNTQTNDGNASPVYWAIEEDKQEISFEGEGEPFIYIPDECETHSLSDFVELIDQLFDDELNDDDDTLKQIWNDVDKKDVYDVVDFANRSNIGYNCSEIWLKTVRRISDQTGCFITKRAAQKHLELNDYHYNNGHTYALTAWRNPEFERLLNIIKTIDISQFKIDEE